MTTEGKRRYRMDPNRDYRDPEFCGNEDGETLNQGAVTHYDECYRDYLTAWCNRDNLALHYGYWDRSEPYRHHRALLDKNRLLYEKAEIVPGDRVLDAGCGIGGSAIWMGKHHDNRVTGISISARQVHWAGHHAKRHGVADKVRFEVADFCRMPFPDESFDVVWALESACHALHKGDFIQEAWRVLRPGGRLVVCDGFLLQREFSPRQWKAVVTCLNGWAVPNLCSRPEFQGLLEEAGFREISVCDITRQTLPSARHMYKVARRLYPVQKISQWLGLRTRAQTANYHVGLAQLLLFEERLTEYCVFVGRKPAGRRSRQGRGGLSCGGG